VYVHNYVQNVLSQSPVTAFKVTMNTTIKAEKNRV